MLQPSPKPLTGQPDNQARPNQPETSLATHGRLMSMDAYRGFVMILMVAEILQFHRLHEAFPDNAFWAFLAYHQSHVEWAGCSLHDLIQPSFSFLVGVALPYSMASRSAQGQPLSVQFGHALRRSLILILLGIFLRSIHAEQTNFTFEDTLTQIGLGYPFLFLLGHPAGGHPAIWGGRIAPGWTAFGLILFMYWLAFVLYPLPGPNFNYEAVGVPTNWPEHYTGLMTHFNKNSNLAWAFDTWFLNLFPRESPFLFNGGGYATLSFIPTLGTMVLGLQIGRWLRSGLQPSALLKRLLLAGAIGLVSGVLLHVAGICPIVKRIWTPAWVLFSGGWCCWLLAFFYSIIDATALSQTNSDAMQQKRSGHRWAFPLLVFGMNSIAIYCLAHLIDRFIINSFYTHLGHRPFQIFGEVYEPLLVGLATMVVFYGILRWMYRRKLFIRI